MSHRARIELADSVTAPIAYGQRTGWTAYYKTGLNENLFTIIYLSKRMEKIIQNATGSVTTGQQKNQQLSGRRHIIMK